VGPAGHRRAAAAAAVAGRRRDANQVRPDHPTDNLKQVLHWLAQNKRSNSDVARALRLWFANHKLPIGIEKLVAALRCETERDLEKNGHPKDACRICITVAVLHMWLLLEREDRWVEQFIRTDTPLAHSLKWAIHQAVQQWLSENIRENGISPNRGAGP
jgi:hypothetical protein